MRSRREIEVFSLSFLDCICCGFGAIILLLVLSKNAEPYLLEEATQDLRQRIAGLQERRSEIRGETRVLNRELRTKQEQLSRERKQLARLQGDLAAVRGEFETSHQDSAVASIIEGRLAQAQQSLTEEMRRLLGESYRRSSKDQTIGGIPVDSEYIIFIIDTSGSMFSYAWELMLQKVSETLDIYPEVKGIQVLNDEGEYMFPQYQGDWIPDSSVRRRAIIERLRTWTPFSDSSPVEGITHAIQTFYAPDKRISLYVFGDEFTGGSIDEVVETVDRINATDEQGERRVRIHAVGFPTQFARPAHLQTTGIRFAMLMRTLCFKNGGTFVGLDRFAP
jgi:hypothetical protein